MLKVKQIINPEVFYKAEAFHITAKIIVNNEKLKFHGAPFIVNSTLAIELYLKSMLSNKCFGNLKHGKYSLVYSEVKKGHDLVSLFSKIPDNLKKQLSKRCSETTSKIEILNFLKEYKDHFINWRYSFEGKARYYKPNEILFVMEIFNQFGRNILDGKVS